MKRRSKVLIVGAGKGGTALIEMLSKDENVELAGVVDIDEGAAGIKLAQELGIRVSRDYSDFLKEGEIDEVINVTGLAPVQEDLLRRKPDNVEVVGGHSSELFWMLIEQHRQAEEGLEIINGALLEMGDSFEENISLITMSCGKALRADFALYQRLEAGMLSPLGRWQVPDDCGEDPDHKGQMCLDVIRSGHRNEVTTIEDLDKTEYAEKEPNVKKYGIRSYAGCPVFSGDECVGVLCVFFTENKEFTERDRQMMRVFADVISREEEKRKVSRKFERSEERYKVLVENMKNPVFIVNRNGKYLYMNANARQSFLGLEGEYSEKSLWDIFPGDIADGQMADMLKVMDSGKGYTAEVEVPLPGGDRWYQMTIQPLSCDADICQNVLGIAADITDRKSSEKQMEKAGRFLDRIVNSIADPIFVKDREHRWIVLNDAFCQFMGYPKRDLLGKSDYEYFPKSEADVFWEKDEEVFRSKAENVNEEELTDSAGKTHTIVTKKSLYVDEEGKEILVGVIRDITEKKKIEQALLVSEAKYRTLAENTSDNIWLMDLEGNLIYTSASVEQLFGFAPEEVLERNLVGMLTPGSYDKAMKMLRDVLEGVGGEWTEAVFNENYKIELEQYRREGGTAFTESSMRFIRDEEGNIRILGVTRDITQRKRASEVLDKTNKELRWKIQELEAAMSHIKKLEGLVPICANCKKMRLEDSDPRDPTSWISMERYITDRTDASFTHGLCPECVKKMYGESLKKKDK